MRYVKEKKKEWINNRIRKIEKANKKMKHGHFVKK
jgi:hypothetical protein